MRKGSPPLFGYKLTNDPRVLSLFPALSSSPILADLGWSPLIQGAFLANAHHLGLPPSHTSLPSLDPREPLKGLLVLHVRRGDYEQWCRDAVKHGDTFVGFNQFPELPDRPPQARPHDEGAFERCLPSIEQIVAKVRNVTVDSEKEVKHVYIMTNAHQPWLAQLVAALVTSMPQGVSISTSRDLSLSPEAKYVSQAVDMMIAQKAEMMIGNGYSSLTGNIVMLRMHNPRLDPRDTRFW